MPRVRGWHACRAPSALPARPFWDVVAPGAVKVPACGQGVVGPGLSGVRLPRRGPHGGPRLPRGRENEGPGHMPYLHRNTRRFRQWGHARGIRIVAVVEFQFSIHRGMPRNALEDQS
eukprot:5206706-Prymnesium_polylepis.2